VSVATAIPTAVSSQRAAGPLTDEQLVSTHLGGDRSAFTTLVTRYEDKLYRLAYRMLGNHHDALDAVQEILIKLLASMEKFKFRSAFGTWLYRLAANTCLDVRRKRGRTAVESLDEALRLSPRGTLTGMESLQGDPDAFFEQHYQEELIRQALRRLPEHQRLLLELRDIEELTNQEVADMLGIEVGALKARLHRARQALKRILDAGVNLPGGQRPGQLHARNLH
jgi:RNA polymerase sigma-70 factor, ECF subfamily